MKNSQLIIKLLVPSLATLALLASPAASFAQAGWASACSASASIEEVSLANYRFSGPSLMHLQGATGIVRARYSVQNTSFPNTPTPPWTTLELGYLDKAAGYVEAELFGVKVCTSAIFSICSVTSVDAADGTCITCTFPSDTFDFNNYIYYVTLKVFRSTTDVDVRANTLRIY